MPIRNRRCKECGREYSLLERNGDLSALDHSDIDHLSCPDCDSDAFEGVVSLGTGIELGGDGGAGRDFPYFDRGLGMRIESAAHRRRVCKEKGIVPLETNGARLVQEQAARDNTVAEADERAYNEMVDRQAHDPELRRAQDIFRRIVAGAKNPQEARERLRRR